MDAPGSGAAAPAPPPRPQRDWNAVAAIIASLIGLLALLVSGYTAMLQKEQVRASVWPYLQPGISPRQRMLVLGNQGVGPAKIRGVEVYVDGKAQRDWPSAFVALGLPDLANTPYSTTSGVVLAPGDVIQQLTFAETADFVRFYEQYTRIQMHFCYCSALDECWHYDERRPDRGRERQPVDRCPAAGTAEFSDNQLAIDVTEAVK